MNKPKTLLKILTVLPIILLYISCNPVSNDSRSGSMLIVEYMVGTDMAGSETSYLQSDVIFQDPTDPEKTSIYADSATASFRTRLVDPNSLTGPSHYNDITVTRYIVTYWRADGRNTEGVDIPYSFEGYLSAIIPVDSVVEVPFIIVREVAKLEPPLIGLQEWRDAGVIEVQAKVEFFGEDQTGRKVNATGYLTIFFANYANETGSG
jgi:hypothetical protein